MARIFIRRGSALTCPFLVDEVSGPSTLEFCGLIKEAFLDFYRRLPRTVTVEKMITPTPSFARKTILVLMPGSLPP